MYVKTNLLYKGEIQLHVLLCSLLPLAPSKCPYEACPDGNAVRGLEKLPLPDLMAPNRINT